MNDLNGKPTRHPVKRWVERANEVLDEEHKITMHGIARRCGHAYTYVNAIVNGHMPATKYIEDRLQSVITECKEIIGKNEAQKKK